eukprot:896404-Ditylum_brightwellii.AAC.1
MSVGKVVGETWEEKWCSKKPMQWLQWAEAFPYTQKGEGLCVLTWEVVGISTNKMFLLLSLPPSFSSFYGKITELDVCYWVYFDPVAHSTIHPSPRPNVNYLWESTAKLLLDS